MILAGAIFVLTLIMIIWQPGKLSIGWSAVSGAAIAMMNNFLVCVTGQEADGIPEKTKILV